MSSTFSDVPPSRQGIAAVAVKESEALKRLTERIIGCAIEVHRQLGPGLLEGTYEAALCIELQLAGLNFVRQPVFPVVYKGQVIGEYRLDLIVEDTVIVEIKSVERFDPIFEAQVLTYLRVTGKGIGLLMNFNSRLLRDGIKRYVLS
ncbi:MAG TPA: GxxExxY protein [Pyrinomonadaceae bacterium]|nr:GxxExxY protein [Pyrinomonadaceae bacterium]